MSGTLYGIGVGPGDPELVTLKAARLIAAAPVVAYIAAAGRPSRARAAAADHIGAHAREIALEIPMDADRSGARRAYREGAATIESTLASGRDVALLCEGDPLFYASFGYVRDHLGPTPVEIVPGIGSVQGAAALLGDGLTRQDERLAVVTARNADAAIAAALADYEAVAVLKAGPRREHLLRLVRAAGRWAETAYVEYVGLPEEAVYRDLDAVPAGPGPYFSVLLTLPREPRCGP